MIDSSRVRGPTNIFKDRPTTPFTGRQLEMYKVMHYIKSPIVKLLNVSGLSGIGKTRFVLETAYYMHVRLDFTDGIFIIDLNNIKTPEGIKDKLRDQNVVATGQDIHSDLQKKSILLIFDNIDNVLKHSKT